MTVVKFIKILWRQKTKFQGFDPLIFRFFSPCVSIAKSATCAAVILAYPSASLSPDLHLLQISPLPTVFIPASLSLMCPVVWDLDFCAGPPPVETDFFCWMDWISANGFCWQWTVFNVLMSFCFVVHPLGPWNYHLTKRGLCRITGSGSAGKGSDDVLTGGAVEGSYDGGAGYVRMREFRWTTTNIPLYWWWAILQMLLLILYQFNTGPVLLASIPILLF